MSFFSQLGGRGTGANPAGQQNPMQIYQQLRQNPAAVLQQAGFQIPNGMTNPQQMVMHLLQSGQISPTAYQQAIGAAPRFSGR